MHHHPKTYEDVFSSEPLSSKNRIKLESISIENMETDEYMSLFKTFLSEFYSDLFSQCIKLSWLRRKFTYAGKKAKIPMYASSRSFVGKFTKFIRRFLGHDIQIITKGYFFSKLETYYFNTLFPGFEEGNPFTNPEYYKFPYQNISLEYLILVYQLDDRFELLKEADKQKMSYAVFLDYVINHLFTENEILGRDRYTLKQNTPRQSPMYFKDCDKHFKSIKGEKRI